MPGKTLDDLAAEEETQARRLRQTEPPLAPDDVSMLLACSYITLAQLRFYWGPEQDRARFLEQDLAAARQGFCRARGLR